MEIVGNLESSKILRICTYGAIFHTAGSIPSSPSASPSLCDVLRSNWPPASSNAACGPITELRVFRLQLSVHRNHFDPVGFIDFVWLVGFKLICFVLIWFVWILEALLLFQPSPVTVKILNFIVVTFLQILIWFNFVWYVTVWLGLGLVLFDLIYLICFSKVFSDKFC